MRIDLNCDMGEGMDHDAAIMPCISSANIACGFHAGDATTMQETVALAMKYGVAIGAHPSYPDKENFGRVAMTLSVKEVYDLLLEQMHRLQAIVENQSAELKHVKPHGALYNAAAINAPLSEAIVNAVYDFNPSLVLFGLANSELIVTARRKGLAYKQEAFADRTYQSDGTLTPRTQPNALITIEQDAVKQVLQMVQQKTVTATDGSVLAMQVDTICIHGDGKQAVSFARTLNHSLQQKGIQISAS